jgi:hypothetical protein
VRATMVRLVGLGCRAREAQTNSDGLDVWRIHNPQSDLGLKVFLSQILKPRGFQRSSSLPRPISSTNLAHAQGAV